jgi:hypothetical protein
MSESPDIDGRGDNSPSLAGRPYKGAIFTPAGDHVRSMVGLLPETPLPERLAWDEQAGLPEGDMLGNDKAGDCVEVAILNRVAIELHEAVGTRWRPYTDDALDLYRRLAGYDGTEGTDKGTPTGPAFDRIASEGYTPAGVAQWSWNPRRCVLRSVQAVDALRRAVYFLGSVLVTVNLPRAWDEVGAPWTMPGTADEEESVGEHEVLIVGWEADGKWRVRTWGTTVLMSQGAAQKFVLEANAFASLHWIRPDGTTPAGQSRAEFEAIYQQLGA